MQTLSLCPRSRLLFDSCCLCGVPSDLKCTRGKHTHSPRPVAPLSSKNQLLRLAWCYPCPQVEAFCPCSVSTEPVHVIIALILLHCDHLFTGLLAPQPPAPEGKHCVVLPLTPTDQPTERIIGTIRGGWRISESANELLF